MHFVDGHRARKRFGQHFLADAGVVQAIVEAIRPREGDSIVEIGPGLGALTDALLDRVDALQVVELDRDLAARLRLRHPESRLTVHEADALEFDFRLALRAGDEGQGDSAQDDAQGGGGQGDDGRRLRIVGNLPYNISSPLLVRLLDHRAMVEDQHFMLQKEVVERIVGEPGTSDYGRLSVLMQSYFVCVRLFDVPPAAFDPPPRVDSAVLRMVVRADRSGEDPAPLQKVLAVAFGQRRKMLRGTLLPWLARRGVASDGIDPTARAEELDVQTWRGLAQRLAAAEGAAG